MIMWADRGGEIEGARMEKGGGKERKGAGRK